MMSKTTENIIVIVIMVAIVIGLLCGVGYGNVKEWLSTPFVWKEQDLVDIKYLGSLKIEGDPRLLFSVYNSTDEDITDYEFQVITPEGSVEFESYDASVVRSGKYTSSDNDIDANGYTTISFNCNAWDADTKHYAYLENLDSQRIEALQYRIVRLETIGDKLFSNNGTWKVIIILATSLALGLLGLVERFPVWLRIILKVCGLPCWLAIGVILVIFAVAAGGSSSSGGSNSAGEDAQRRYKRAASLKAGAEKTGNARDAAKAQEEMDRAMADMIVAQGSGSSAAREAADRYKRAANHKAGAVMTGRTGDAARAQAEMDRAMADMVKKK